MCQQRIARWLPRNKPCQSSYQSAPNSPSPEKKRGITLEKQDEGGKKCVGGDDYTEVV